MYSLTINNDQYRGLWNGGHVWARRKPLMDSLRRAIMTRKWSRLPESLWQRHRAIAHTGSLTVGRKLRIADWPIEWAGIIKVSVLALSLVQVVQAGSWLLPISQANKAVLPINRPVDRPFDRQAGNKILLVCRISQHREWTLVILVVCPVTVTYLEAPISQPLYGGVKKLSWFFG